MRGKRAHLKEDTSTRGVFIVVDDNGNYLTSALTAEDAELWCINNDYELVEGKTYRKYF